VLAKSARTLTYADEGTPPPPEALVEAIAGMLPAGATGMRLPESGAPVTPVGAYGSAIITSLTARNTRIGALVIFRDRSATFFTAEEVRRAEIFSGQLALALDNTRLLEELEEKVHEVTRTRDQLIFSEKLTLTGQLTAGVAHEINTPLNYVKINLDFVLKQLQEEMTTGTSAERLQQSLVEVRTALGDVREGVERIVKIVRSLNMFAHPDRKGDDAVDLEKVDLPKVLDWSASVAAAHIRARARLKKDYAATPLVLGNESRLGQIFVNLLVNAAQAIEPEQSAENEITIRTRVDGANAIVEVQDTGPGIDPAIQERIFEPFFTTKPVGTGTGLGLSICRTIANDHKGTLTVESVPGRGATFRLTLPAAGAGTAPAA
jgi:signal transduction histidine kinase